jgi:hypothetical protein
MKYEKIEDIFKDFEIPIRFRQIPHELSLGFEADIKYDFLFAYCTQAYYNVGRKNWFFKIAIDVDELPEYRHYPFKYRYLNEFPDTEKIYQNSFYSYNLLLENDEVRKLFLDQIRFLYKKRNKILENYKKNMIKNL